MNTKPASFRLWMLAILALVVGGFVASANIASATDSSGDDAVVNAWVDCDGNVNVTSTKNISNVVVDFASAPDYKFDGLSGTSFSFSYTDDMVGVWIKSGNNDSGDGPGYGQYVALSAPTDCEPDPDPSYTIVEYRECGELVRYEGVVDRDGAEGDLIIMITSGTGQASTNGDSFTVVPDDGVDVTFVVLIGEGTEPITFAGSSVVNDDEGCAPEYEVVLTLARDCDLNYTSGTLSASPDGPRLDVLIVSLSGGVTVEIGETDDSVSLTADQLAALGTNPSGSFEYGAGGQGISVFVVLNDVTDCEPDPVCEDEDATNTGEPLPCEYPDPDPDPVCEDEDATNTGEPLPCEYPDPDPVCEDPKATNTGGKLPCTYPPKPPVTPPAPVPTAPVKTPAPETT